LCAAICTLRESHWMCWLFNNMPLSHTSSASVLQTPHEYNLSRLHRPNIPLQTTVPCGTECQSKQSLKFQSSWTLLSPHIPIAPPFHQQGPSTFQTVLLSAHVRLAAATLNLVTLSAGPGVCTSFLHALSSPRPDLLAPPSWAQPPTPSPPLSQARDVHPPLRHHMRMANEKFTNFLRVTGLFA
jgi:hypothetical protein